MIFQARFRCYTLNLDPYFLMPSNHLRLRLILIEDLNKTALHVMNGCYFKKKNSIQAIWLHVDSFMNASSRNSTTVHGLYDSYKC